MCSNIIQISIKPVNWLTAVFEFTHLYVQYTQTYKRLIAAHNIITQPAHM